MSYDPRIKLQNIDLDIFTPETKSKLKSMSDEADKILNQHSIIKYETHYSIMLILITCIILLFCMCKLFFFIKSCNRLTYRFPKVSRSVQAESPTENIECPLEQTTRSSSVTSAKASKHDRNPEDIPLPSIRSKI